MSGRNKITSNPCEDRLTFNFFLGGDIFTAECQGKISWNVRGLCSGKTKLSVMVNFLWG